MEIGVSAPLVYNHTKEINTSNNVFYKHCHDYYEIIYIIDGNAKVNIDGKIYTANSNTAVFICPFQYHFFELSSTVYDRIVIRFSDSLLPKPVEHDFSQKTKSIAVTKNQEVLNILHNVYYAIKKIPSEYGEDLINCYIKELLYFLYLHSEELSGIDEYADENEKTIAKIIEYIDEHISEKITLSDISENMFMSVSGLCHTFKAAMQTSILQYINQHKIAYANKLILSGKKLSEVYYLCGFESYSGFLKAYKKYNRSHDETVF